MAMERARYDRAACAPSAVTRKSVVRWCFRVEMVARQAGKIGIHRSPHRAFPRACDPILQDALINVGERLAGIGLPAARPLGRRCTVRFDLSQ
jgi:hypothetical protein